jgi:hypothetical protein
MWPKAIAPIKSKGIKKSRPQIKLAIAFPLVSAFATGAGAVPAPGITADPSETTRPQARQNLSSAVTLFPHPSQNDAIQPPVVRQVSFGGAQKIARNILSVRLGVNLQVNLCN